ncbi:MAG: hypothetical protein Kow0063_16230 [Anaerolineae bacterium]
MDRLRVRVYNVRFGDALLVSVPDRAANGSTEMRHILIDVGNVLGGEGGEDVLFRPVIEDILRTLDGRRLDLYVMTHEHMDHVQGLLYAEEKLFPDKSLRDMLRTRHAWLTASAEPGYYAKEGHEQARKAFEETRETYAAIARFLAAAPEQETPWLRALMLNNDPRNTADCVDYLRGLAGKTWYVYRGLDLAGKHPFQEARFEIWAPEEDTSVYYGKFQPMALGVAQGGRKPTLTLPVPPPGVDAGTFYNLVDMRRWGFADNLLAIDRAANNTSLVFCLEWRGWRLLFPGDAELRSWKTMHKYGQLKPVHFLKVSHHGSHNGTPPRSLIDIMLPAASAEAQTAVVSAYRGTYKDVPHDATLVELGGRCSLHSVLGMPDGYYLDVEFTENEDGRPGRVTVRA